KLRAETEKKLREEAAAKARAEAEAKAKAAREAALRLAAEAKAKAEAEAKAKIEAERRAREEAERKAREEAEQARREAEELRQRLEEERKAREEAERKAREEVERRAREEAERKAREDAERKAREEAERRAREEAERQAREEAERKAREEAERKARAEQDAQMRRAREEAERRRAQAEEEKRRAAEAPKPPPPEPPPASRPQAKAAGEGLDALMADLDSFTQRDDEDRKAREEAESRAKEDRKRRLREESEQRERDEAERARQEAEDRLRREEEERRAREDEERRAAQEAEREREEAEERARRARESIAAHEAQPGDDIGVTDDDLGMDDVRRDEATVAKESRKAQREREREQRRLDKEARERARAAAKAAARAKPDDTVSVRVAKVRRRRNWGRPVSLVLFLVLLAGLGALHLMPVSTEEYQRAAAEALRQPVRIGSARLSLYSGLQIHLSDVRIGEGTRIATVRAYPKLGSLFGPEKAFNRIELDGVALRQDALGESLFARARGPNFSVERIVIKDLKLQGPVPLPLLQADARLAADGSVRLVQLQGPEGLLGQILPKNEAVEFDLTAAGFSLPFAPEVSLSSFAMKGRATRLGMRIESWGGSLLGGAVSGTANLRWGGSWQLDGVLTARGINAAVFAPALLSEGNAEGTGKFSMSGADPAALARAGRVEGSFTIGKGVLGSFDLSRAIRTDGREVNGRTQFVELNGQGTYDRGAVALRNVVIGAGALQAGASADISQSGALSGRIVADVRTPSQSLRATLLLGGTVKEPQVRN
ncbi:MAG TPA: hypothetical protein VHG88_16355, partial [Burkholderiales bacterium]|nr:hypothetical protein [Burkholderiales bacterium]